MCASNLTASSASGTVRPSFVLLEVSSDGGGGAPAGPQFQLGLRSFAAGRAPLEECCATWRDCHSRYAVNVDRNSGSGGIPAASALRHISVTHRSRASSEKSRLPWA